MSTWIMPANANYFNHEKAFTDNGFIDWKQTRNYSVNDIILIYSTRPESSIKYIAKVIRTNLSSSEIINQDQYWKKDIVSESKRNRYCRLKLIQKINDEKLSYLELKKHGMHYVPQSPGRVSEPLLAFIYSEVEIKDEEIN